MATEAKHTPGPWTIGANTSSSCPVLSPRHIHAPHMVERYGAPDTLEAVAICRGESERRKANARLIAAAPDLLAALQALLAAGVYADGEGLVRIASADTEDGEAAVKLARAAIAKAIHGEP